MADTEDYSRTDVNPESTLEALAGPTTRLVADIVDHLHTQPDIDVASKYARLVQYSSAVGFMVSSLARDLDSMVFTLGLYAISRDIIGYYRRYQADGSDSHQ